MTKITDANKRGGGGHKRGRENHDEISHATQLRKTKKCMQVSSDEIRRRTSSVVKCNEGHLSLDTCFKNECNGDENLSCRF